MLLLLVSRINRVGIDAVVLVRDKGYQVKNIASICQENEDFIKVIEVDLGDDAPIELGYMGVLTPYFTEDRLSEIEEENDEY